MEPTSDLLFTMAEVAAAFAGFATLVTAILQRHAVNLPRVLSMVSLSLMVVVFALLPSVLSMYGFDETGRWQLACGALAVGWLLYWFLVMRAIRASRFGVSFAEMPRSNRLNAFVFHPLGIAMATAGALGAYGGLAAAFYATALLVLLSFAGFLFVQITWSSFSDADE